MEGKAEQLEDERDMHEFESEVRQFNKLVDKEEADPVSEWGERQAGRC